MRAKNQLTGMPRQQVAMQVEKSYYSPTGRNASPPSPLPEQKTTSAGKRWRMHSFGSRANAFVTYAAMVASLMWAMTTFSDSFNSPSPSAQIQISNIKYKQKQPRGDDEVSLKMNITADLQSVFTWNTKQLFVFVAAEYETPKNALNQVSLWDAIIPAKEHANFWVQTTNKYKFVDQGSNLRGKNFNLTLHWHVMPKVGKMFADKLVMSGYRMPAEYR